MNRLIVAVVGGALVGGLITWLFTTGPSREAAESGAAGPPSRVVRKDGLVLVNLDAEARRQAGVRVDTLSEVSLEREIEAFGRVLDPAALATGLAERAAARAAQELSAKELKRLKVLYAQEQNVSTRTLEAAEAAAQRDQAAAEAAELRLRSAWGPAVARDAQSPGWLSALSGQAAALVRVDIPLGARFETPPAKARLAATTSADTLFEAQVLSAAPSVDPQLQGQGFLLLTKQGSLPPGTAVTAWLTKGGELEHGCVVPRGALLRNAGKAQVYVQTGDDSYVRRDVALERPTAAGWFVRSGVKAGDAIVTAGAEQLLSEELKGQVESE